MVADELVWPVGQQRWWVTSVWLNMGLDLLVWKVVVCGLKWEKWKDGIQRPVWECRMQSRGVSDVGLVMLMALE